MRQKTSLNQLCCAIALGLFAGPVLRGQEVTAPTAQTLPVEAGLDIRTIPLWNGIPPGAKGPSNKDTPTLSIFAPEPGRGNGTAVLIAPGGGYLNLAMNLEGRQVADWFAARGVTAFVLKYRVGADNPYPIPLLDAQRAMRLIRSLSDRYELSRGRIGAVGFSAGGHLVAVLATENAKGDMSSADPVERLSDRPDFLVLGYAWLNAMEAKGDHLSQYCTLLRTIPVEKCRAYEQKYTPALHVTARTPQTFIYATTDDSTVPVSASVGFYNALVSAGVPAEMHLFRHGDHGSGLGSGSASLDMWPALLEQWLRDQGLLTVDPEVARIRKEELNAPPRKPGEHLSLNSRMEDIMKDPGAAAVIARICGSGFLNSLPIQAKAASLKALIPYFPSKLTDKNLEEIRTEFAKLPVS